MAILQIIVWILAIAVAFILIGYYIRNIRNERNVKKEQLGAQLNEEDFMVN